MPANLIEALVAWADDQPWIVSAFPGGVHNTDAPTGASTPLPYLTFTQGDTRVLNVIGGGTRSVQWPTVMIEARAVYAADARNLGGQIRDLLLVSGPLAWLGGTESGRYETEGEGGELEEGLGPDGSDVWVHRIPIVFCCSRW